MNEKYRLSSHGHLYWISKWRLISGEKGFWQQISPQYFRKGNAIRYAKRNNIILENDEKTR